MVEGKNALERMLSHDAHFRRTHDWNECCMKLETKQKIITKTINSSEDTSGLSEMQMSGGE